MGNCMGEKDKKSDDFETLAARDAITKQKWFKLLKVDKIKYDESNCMRHKYDHQSFIQIDKDINRTYPNEPQFKVAANKAMFKNALQEITLHFPKQGYIQGINFVVGFFILVEMNELETIKTFIAAVTHPRLMLIGNYEDDFPLTRLSCQLFWSVFSEQSPEFANKIKQLNLPDELWIFQWFLCLYIYSFPRSYIKDILNFIWEEKEFSWIKLALAIMKMLEPVLTSSKNKFQDDFIESIELVKTDSYVKKHLPLGKLIKKARQYDLTTFRKHLKKVTIENWYKQYFLADDRKRYDMYKKLEEQLEHNRKDHFSMQRSGMKSSHQNKSMTIIDEIEQLRASKVGGHVINSLSNKVVNSSFARFKQNYSMGEYGQKGDISLVESYYH